MEEQKNEAVGVLDAPLFAPVVKVKKKRASKHDFKDGRGRVFAHRHVNGNGWVADTAKVADAVEVAKFAQVYHNAAVTGRALIRNHAHVCGNAQISGTVHVSNCAIVAGRAEISNSCRISNAARVYGGCLSGSTTVYGESFVRDEPRVHNCVLRDAAGISGRATVIQTSLEGQAYIGGEAQVSSSVLRGYVTVGGNAQVISSKLVQISVYTNDPADLTRERSRLKVLDFAVIANVDAVNALLAFRGHSVVANGHIIFRPAYDSNVTGYIRIDVHEDALFAGAYIDNLVQFNAYNVSRTARRQQNTYNPAATANLPRAINLNELVPSRRLMSL